MKKLGTRFAIIAIYVDDLNLVGTLEELTRIANYLKKEFEMKNLMNFFFRLVDQAFPYWIFGSPIGIYHENLKALLYG